MPAAAYMLCSMSQQGAPDYQGIAALAIDCFPRCTRHMHYINADQVPAAWSKSIGRLTCILYADMLCTDILLAFRVFGIAEAT